MTDDDRTVHIPEELLRKIRSGARVDETRFIEGIRELATIVRAHERSLVEPKPAIVCKCPCHTRSSWLHATPCCPQSQAR